MIMSSMPTPRMMKSDRKERTLNGTPTQPPAVGKKVCEKGMSGGAAPVQIPRAKSRARPTVRTIVPGQEKGEKFPTLEARISVDFHSFRLILGRAIISRSALDAWMFFPERARAKHSC